VGKSCVRQRAVLVAASGQTSVAIDNPPSLAVGVLRLLLLLVGMAKPGMLRGRLTTDGGLQGHRALFRCHR
jgi:hypothetical protein